MATKKVSVKESADESVFADKVWESIKDLEIEIYALPDQVLKDHATRVDIMPDQVHLVLKSPAVLPVIEELIRKRGPKMGVLSEYEDFEVSQTRSHTVIKAVVKEF